MKPATSPLEGRRGHLKGGQPRAFRHHKGSVARAYLPAYRALVGQYGPPPRRSELERRMKRAAVAAAALDVAEAVWCELGRQREQGKGRRPSVEIIRAASKDMDRASQNLTRALGDLTAALPPAPILSKKERDAAEREATMVRLTAERVAREAARKAIVNLETPA
jgi:hypothetical protein